MTFKVGDVVKTRDGREVEILKVDAPGDLPIIGCFLDNGMPSNWMESGLWLGDSRHMADSDLLPPKRTREVNWWFNIYETCEVAFISEEQARDNAYGNALAIAVPVTFTLEW